MGKSALNTLMMLLSLVGCFITIALLYEHFHPAADIGCSAVGGDCSKTINSDYGHLGPIPTAAIGLGMYLVLFGLCVQRRRALLALAADTKVRSASSLPESEGALEGAESSFSQASEAYPLLPASLPRNAALLGQAIWLLSLMGAGISFWLQYVAFFVLYSFCPWCFAQAITVTLICI